MNRFFNQITPKKKTKRDDKMTIKQQKHDVNREIERINTQKHELDAKKTILKTKEQELAIELEDAIAIQKLKEKRIWIEVKIHHLEALERDFPNCSHFLTQLKYFNKRYEAWERYSQEHTPILKYNKEEYIKELGLITDVNKQYNQCIDIIGKELRFDVLGFRSGLKTWQKSIEKRIGAIEGK